MAPSERGQHGVPPGASQEEELYRKETWRVNKICQETVMKTERGAAHALPLEIAIQDKGILKQSRREIRCWCLTFTVSGNGRVLTEDVELQDGLGLAHYVLGAAYDLPPVVVGREVGQGEGVAALCLRDLDMETSKGPHIPKIKSVGRRHKGYNVHTHRGGKAL